MSLPPRVQPPPWMCRNAPVGSESGAMIRNGTGVAGAVDLDRPGLVEEHGGGIDAAPLAPRAPGLLRRERVNRRHRRQQALELGVERARLGEQRHRVIGDH